ncbi:MAG: tetratricopeptide repeat protein, partial [Cyanobacteria bacterium J06642_9]
EIREAQLGANHPSTATSLNNLAGLYSSMGRYSEAEPLYLRALAIVFSTLGENHPNTQTGLSNFVGLLKTVREAGQLDQLSDDPTTQLLLQNIESGEA